jgi:hypothetical protein
MSDSVNTRILIGGNIKSDKIPDLAKALYDDCDGFRVNINDNECLISKIGEKLVSQSTPFRIQFECEYGWCVDTRHVCRENKLSYRVFSRAKDDIDAKLTYWSPHIKKERTNHAAQSGHALVKVEDIRSHTKLDLLLWEEPEIPPFQVV